MTQYVLPVPGDFYVFPAWQPHSVAPFRGDGERWSLAFNTIAIPSQGKAPSAKASAVNLSLSNNRPRPGGFL